jgi:hypothetical protein
MHLAADRHHATFDIDNSLDHGLRARRQRRQVSPGHRFVNDSQGHGIPEPAGGSGGLGNVGKIAPRPSTLNGCSEFQ